MARSRMGFKALRSTFVTFCREIVVRARAAADFPFPRWVKSTAISNNCGANKLPLPSSASGPIQYKKRRSVHISPLHSTFYRAPLLSALNKVANGQLKPCLLWCLPCIKVGILHQSTAICPFRSRTRVQSFPFGEALPQVKESCYLD